MDAICRLGWRYCFVIMSEQKTKLSCLNSYKTTVLYEILAALNLFTLSAYVCICLLALKNDLLL